MDADSKIGNSSLYGRGKLFPLSVAIEKITKRRELYQLLNYINQPETTIRSKINTHTLISTVAYLIGVPLRIFSNEFEPPLLEIYEQLHNNKFARIVRNLCIVRTDFERNYKMINEGMHREYKSISSMPNLIAPESITELSNDGIQIVKSFHTPNEYIIHINSLISDRINNCKDLIPIWVNWLYIRDIYIMPNGLTENGIEEAASVYYKNRDFYPYQVYMNWPASDQGNIFYNDRKFVTLLYNWNNDVFRDFSKVTDASYYTKSKIINFLKDNNQTLVVVDCENSDPFKICSVLRSFSEEYCLNNISKVVLYDDIHSSTAWESLKIYVDVPIERILVERIKGNKSLVDQMLIGGVYREHFQNGMDSFIIVSSDSDYWGLIKSLPEANWLVMIESKKCGLDMKAALRDAGIFYCYIDDFYTANINDFKTAVLIKEVQNYLANRLSLNLNIIQMMDDVTRTTRVNLSDIEMQQFMGKYIKQLRLAISDEGDVSISLG